MTDDLDVAQGTAAEGMGMFLAFFGFIGLVVLGLWEVALGTPSRVLFITAGFVLLVGMFAMVEGS